MPPAVIETMHRATVELIASGAVSRPLKSGDKVPAVTLKDPEGNKLSSADLLASRPLDPSKQITNYREGATQVHWCTAHHFRS